MCFMSCRVIVYPYVGVGFLRKVLAAPVPFPHAAWIILQLPKRSGNLLVVAPRVAALATSQESLPPTHFSSGFNSTSLVVQPTLNFIDTKTLSLFASRRSFKYYWSNFVQLYQCSPSERLPTLWAPSQSVFTSVIRGV